ncbi:hypothetical protein STENM327S_01597 [Streptomyces tendae]
MAASAVRHGRPVILLQPPARRAAAADTAAAAAVADPARPGRPPPATGHRRRAGRAAGLAPPHDRVGWFRLPGVPYLGSFPETNVRLYSVDAHGRRGVVFRSMDASRLVPVLMGRFGFRLPYLWSRMTGRSVGDTLTYTS